MITNLEEKNTFQNVLVFSAKVARDEICYRKNHGKQKGRRLFIVKNMENKMSKTFSSKKLIQNERPFQDSL